jgi:hypothetical protein
MAGDRLGIQPAANVDLHLGNGFHFSGINFDLSNETIHGSGAVTEETRPVSGFDRILLGSQGDVEITQGSTESLVISAESNLLPYITTDVLGDRLVVETKQGVNLSPSPNKPIHYRLTVKNLSSVQLAGMGDVKINSLKTDDLQINTSGMGNFDLPSLTATGNLNVTISGMGDVDVSGTADSLKVQISGAGNYKGAGLKTSQADAQISGTGDATIWAIDSLNARISGAGSVNYYGSPRVNQTISGIGSVKSLGNK